MTPEFEDLCNRVAEINPEAARWLREVAPTYYPGDNSEPLLFEPTNTLYTCMVWAATPQGGSFWEEIAELLGELE